MTTVPISEITEARTLDELNAATNADSLANMLFYVFDTGNLVAPHKKLTGSLLSQFLQGSVTATLPDGNYTDVIVSGSGSVMTVPGKVIAPEHRTVTANEKAAREIILSTGVPPGRESLVSVVAMGSVYYHGSGITVIPGVAGAARINWSVGLPGDGSLDNIVAGDAIIVRFN
ncbi:MAG: hypothetical protein KatS3mg109_0038 [Pirellulaceae bacterium]|nr:MAG: hypothetical protein KatS3mg109_0038 [Pirellulaceae bacterium]